MKLTKILLFAGVMVSLNANANTNSNATCAHGDKVALVQNKNTDLAKVAMVFGTGSQQAPKPAATGKATR